MNTFIFAVCAIAGVIGDVSHLTENGYNYDKPSVVFDVPQHAPKNEQQFSAPSSDYLPPQTQTQYNNPVSTAAQHHDFTKSIHEPANNYLPPQTPYNSPASAPGHHQQIPPSTSEPHLHQYTGPAAVVDPIALFHQQFSQPHQAPSSDYLAPQSQHSGETLNPAQHQQLAQSQYNSPASLNQQEVAQSSPVSFDPSLSPHYHTHQHQQFMQTISAPNSDYLPPQPQYTTTAQETAVEYEPTGPTITSPANDYLPPQQQQQQLHTTPTLSSIAPAISSPTNEYLPAQQDYTTPADVPSHTDHQQLSPPINVPNNEYLEPAPVQQQQLAQDIPSPNADYLPPAEQQQQQDHHHHRHEQHQHEHQYDSQNQIQSDGYHYDVPATRFRFRF